MKERKSIKLNEEEYIKIYNEKEEAIIIAVDKKGDIYSITWNI